MALVPRLFSLESITGRKSLLLFEWIIKVFFAQVTTSICALKALGGSTQMLFIYLDLFFCFQGSEKLLQLVSDASCHPHPSDQMTRGEDSSMHNSDRKSENSSYSPLVGIFFNWLRLFWSKKLREVKWIDLVHSWFVHL